jgi:hypothetical protein
MNGRKSLKQDTSTPLGRPAGRNSEEVPPVGQAKLPTPAGTPWLRIDSALDDLCIPS